MPVYTTRNVQISERLGSGLRVSRTRTLLLWRGRNSGTWFSLEQYLLEESDELWQAHCIKDFKGSVPEEGETWREVYLVSIGGPTEK